MGGGRGVGGGATHHSVVDMRPLLISGGIVTYTAGSVKVNDHAGNAVVKLLFRVLCWEEDWVVVPLHCGALPVVRTTRQRAYKAAYEYHTPPSTTATHAGCHITEAAAGYRLREARLWECHAPRYNMEGVEAW